MNYTDLLSAVCLVLVLEGLFLLAAPLAWKRMAAQMAELPTNAMRVGGGAMIVAGLIALQLVR